MKRSTAAALLAIALLAVVMRLLPLLRSAYWGSDFGEYLALTRSLVQQGFVPLDYDGWGITYPYFPGLFLLNGASIFAGASVELAASLIVPAIAGLVVLPAFLLAVRTTGDDLAGLVAAGFLAVVLFHVYPTSHAIPASLGDFLLVAALVLFVGLRRSPKFFPPLVMTGLAIVVTHHLTAYVLLLFAVAALLLRALLRADLTIRAIRYELAFVAFLAAATIAFWRMHAGPLWSIVAGGSPFREWLLMGGVAAVVASLPLVARARRRLRWRYRPRARSVRFAARAVGLAVATCAFIVAVSIIAPVPGTSIRLEPVQLIPVTPTLAFLSLAAAGRRWVDFAREGPDVTAWFLALLLSVAVGATVVPEILIPYRHMEYLAIPLAIFVGAGARWLSLGGISAASRVAAVGAVALLVAGSAASAFPPPPALAGFDEGIQGRAVESALWIRHHAVLEFNNSTEVPLVAGDHRVSTVMFGFGGVHGSWDRETRFWHTTDGAQALQSLRSVRVADEFLRVDWIVIDQDLRRGLQTSPFAPALPLLPSEEAKFARAPFHKVFDSGYAQVYYVNWGYAL